MKEIYEKIFIKSEADLPKENGTYFVKIKTPPFTQELSAVGYIWENDKEHVNGFWLNKVDWYLRPVQSVEGSAEEILHKIVGQVKFYHNNSQYVRFSEAIKAMHIFAQSKQTAMPTDEEGHEWIRFEDKLPLEGQEIMLVWPSGNYHPEYRKVTKDMLKGDCSLLRWIPIPKYQPLSGSEN